jgi:hypothetical protein
VNLQRETRIKRDEEEEEKEANRFLSSKWVNHSFLLSFVQHGRKLTQNQNAAIKINETRKNESRGERGDEGR